jgi:hypothetical protein
MGSMAFLAIHDRKYHHQKKNGIIDFSHWMLF